MLRLEEFFKLGVQLREELRREAEEVHAHQFAAGEFDRDAPGSSSLRAPVAVLTILVISVTDASFPFLLVQTPRATLPFSERVLRNWNPTIDQWPMPSSAPRLDEIGGEFREGVAAVEVVGIDHGEGLVDRLLGGEHGVGGAPRFHAALGNVEAGGQVVERLEGVFDRDMFVEAAADLRLEFLLEVAADDEDDLAEAGALGVEHRVVEHRLAVRAHGIDLFESAVAAAHAGGEDEEGGRMACESVRVGLI